MGGYMCAVVLCDLWAFATISKPLSRGQLFSLLEIKFLNFKQLKSWAFSSAELTLTKNRLKVIGKGSVKGHANLSKRRKVKRKAPTSTKGRERQRGREIFCYTMWQNGCPYCDKWRASANCWQSIKKKAMSLSKALCWMRRFRLREIWLLLYMLNDVFSFLTWFV